MNPTKQEVFNAYKVIKDIIDCSLEDDNIIFKVSENAPSKYKDMCTSYDKHGLFIVYGGGDHGYLGYEHNIKFRALHDYMHYVNRLSFSFKDEKTLSLITARYFFDQAGIYTFTAKERILIMDIITAEIRGQIEYFEENNEYVKNQTNFINNYLKAV